MLLFGNQKMNQKSKQAYIIGAGVTGLSAAFCLSKNGQYKINVFEREKEIGGMALTFLNKGMNLDLGPHKFFSNLKDREKEVLGIIGETDLIRVKKRSQIRLFNMFIDFPVGPIDIFKINPIVGIKMGFSYFGSILKKMFFKTIEKSYEDYLKNRFGTVAYNLTFAPYANKIWGDPTKLDKELAATRVAAPSLFEMIKQMVFKVKSNNSTEISAEYFYYPKMGSGVFLEKLKKSVIKNGGVIHTESGLTGLNLIKNKVESIIINGKEIKLNKGDILISTIPLEIFCQTNKLFLKDLKNTVAKLKYKNMILVYVVINKEKISNQNWYFFPESKYVFNRVFEQKSFSKFMIPKGKTVLCCEITCDFNNPVWSSKEDKKTIDLVINQLVECGLINRKDVIDSFSERLERAYPVYSVGIRDRLKRIFTVLDKVENFYSVGRQGGFNYVGMIDCFDIGVKTSDFILGQSEFEDRNKLRESFFNYVVID